MNQGYSNGGWNPGIRRWLWSETFEKSQVPPFEDPYEKSSTDKGQWRPSADVYEDDEGYTIIVELPGFSRDDLKISVTRQILKISGQKIEEAREDLEILQRESNPGSFERAFQLPDDVDIANVQAKLEDGILNIRLPKLDNRRPKKIEVR